MLNYAKEKMKQIKVPSWLYYLLVNIIVFVILFLLFEPTAKSDDYDMTNLLYGGIDGEYSPFILYIHVFLGYLMKALLLVFPNVSWYYVLGFSGMILSFSVITYVLGKRGVWDGHRILVIIILFFSGYEFYIRTTFTKTAGIMIVSGLIFLLYLIEEEKKFSLQYILAFFLIVLGIMIRNMVLLMLLGVSVTCFVIFCIENLENREKLKRGVIKFVIISVLLYATSVLLNRTNNFLLNNNEEWAEYKSYNATRAVLFDNSWPDYYEFQEEYEKLSITENDYKMWAELANVTDPDIFTKELMEDIRNIHPIQNDKPIMDSILNASKSLLQYLANNIVFYIFLSSCVLLIYEKGRQGGRKCAFIFSFCLAIYYYLFYRGRIQHHVDAVLFIMATFLVLYYCNKEYCLEKKYRIYLPISLICLSALFQFYEGISSSSYYGTSFGEISSQKKQYEENYERMLSLSKDKEHLYILGAWETNFSYPCFSIFQVIDKEFYSNIYRLNQYSMIVPREILENYGIQNDNPLAEITDSDKIYYCVSESRLFEIDIVEQYIVEHYNNNASAELMEEIDGLYIYRFTTEKI